MDRNAWALCIGHLILAMNSIDVMIDECHQALTGQRPDSSWLKKGLAHRVKALKDKAPDDSELQLILRDALGETDKIREHRNLAAHAWIAVDGQNPLAPGENTKWLLYARKHGDIMRFEDLVSAISRCQKLSDRISEYLAAVHFDHIRKMRGQNSGNPDDQNGGQTQ